MQYFRKVLELSEALAKADPNDPQAKRDLSVSCDRLGDVQLKRGSTDEALDVLPQGSGAERGRWPRPTPTTPRPDATWRLVHQARRRAPAAGRPTRRCSPTKALELSEALAKADPVNVQTQPTSS